MCSYFFSTGPLFFIPRIYSFGLKSVLLWITAIASKCELSVSRFVTFVTIHHITRATALGKPGPVPSLFKILNHSCLGSEIQTSKYYVLG